MTLKIDTIGLNGSALQILPLDATTLMVTIEGKRYLVSRLEFDNNNIFELSVNSDFVSVSRIQTSDVDASISGHQGYGGPNAFILDMQNINSFLYGKAKIFQDKSVRKIALALAPGSGVQKYLRLGVAGARACPYQPGGEVVEYSYIDANGGGISYSQSGYLPAGGTFSKRTLLHGADKKTLRDERTIYSHTMWLPHITGDTNGNICLELKAKGIGFSLLDIIRDTALRFGIKSYGMQIVVQASDSPELPRVTGRVLRHLPHGNIKTLDQARDIASEHEFPLYPGQKTIFFGTYYPRVEPDWERFRSGKPYEPLGHVHGYIVSRLQRDDQHNLFHLRNLDVTPGTMCQVLLTPISHVMRVEPVVKRGHSVVSRTNGAVVAHC